MIKLITETADFPKFCGAFAAKIKGQMISYGLNRPFALFWRQVTKSGETTALISRFDNYFTLAVLKGTNLDEIKEFMKIIGGQSLTCSEAAARAMGFDITHSFAVLSMIKPCDKKALSPVFLEREQLQKTYDILCTSKQTAPGDFDAWHADISHRLRHGTARLVSSDKAAGVASVCGDKMLINAVCVLSKYRGQGEGERVLKALCENMGKIYVFSVNENVGFYEKLGFKLLDTGVNVNELF